MKMTPDQMKRIEDKLLRAGSGPGEPEVPASFARGVMREIAAFGRADGAETDDIFGALLWRFASASTVCALLLVGIVVGGDFASDDQLLEVLCQSPSIVSPVTMQVDL